MEEESIPNHSSRDRESKKQSFNVEDNTLLPGLPDDLALLCLISIPHSILFSVCCAWRRLLYSSSFPQPFFSLYALLSPPPPYPTSIHDTSTTNSIQFCSLDPLSTKWKTLPYPSVDPPLHLLYHHPSFLSRNLPIQSLTVSNHLVLIAATTFHLVPALSRPLLFHPESHHWSFGPPFTNPRRWCATGSVNSAVYLATGVGLHYSGEVARTMEKWDMKDNKENWKWVKMGELKDGRFCREAVEAVGWRGKLCMVNVKGYAPKDGWVYSVDEEKWENMPIGMLAGWTGPAAASMDEQVMYIVDEVKGMLSEYDGENDSWKKIIELPQLKGAQQITVGRGRVCVVCANGEKIVVLDVVATPPRVWMVEPPSGHQVVALHILPRMSNHD